jgi:lipopolysaccharide biosynthesis glycosyltransferase
MLSEGTVEQLRKAASEPSFDACAGICRDLGEQLNLETIDGPSLLLIATIAYHAHDLKLARRAVGEVISRDEHSADAFLRLGTIELRDGNLNAAMEHFIKSVELDVTLAEPWIQIALVKRLLQQNANIREECLKFAELNKEKISRVHFGLLKQAADAAFEKGDLTSANCIFECLDAFGEPDESVSLRLAESLLSIGEHRRAISILRSLYDAGKLQSWGLCSYAVASMEMGDYEQSELAFRELFASGARETHFDTQYLRFLFLKGEPERARAFVDSLSEKISRHDYDRLLFTYKVKAGKLLAAFEQFAGGDIEKTHETKYLFIELAYKLDETREYEKAKQIIDGMDGLYGGEVPVLALKINHSFAIQDWQEADRILRSVDRQVIEESPELKLKQFELFAFYRDFGKAAAILSRLGPPDALPASYLPPIVRFHAEMRDWPAVLDLARLLLVRGFKYDSVGDIIFRACRHCAKHDELVGFIEGLPDWSQNKDIKKLRAVVLEDAAVDEAAILRLLDDNYVTEFSWARQRLLQKSMVLKSPRKGARNSRIQRPTVFFCSDAAYLCATMVSFYSFLRAHQGAPKAFNFVFVVDDEIHDTCSQAVQKIGRLFGVQADILKASKIIPTGQVLSGDYGLFTGGHSLAAAAYYRVFFAQYAKQQMKVHRALYIDSDTIISGAVQDLLNIDLKEKPLAARQEPLRPEVKKAILAHGLPNNEYFNSGVLLFNFASEHFAAGVNQAIAAIQDKDRVLLFHDQCALNIGFVGHIHKLDQRYNRYVGVREDPGRIESENTILHFLDRPKPWDVTHDGPAGAYWFRYWKELASVISGSVALELLVLAQR